MLTLKFNTRVWLIINSFLVLFAIMFVDPMNYSKSILIDLIHFSFFLVIVLELLGVGSLLLLKSKMKLIEKPKQEISLKTMLSVFMENLYLLLMGVTVNVKFGWYIIATYLSLRFVSILVNVVKHSLKK